MRVELLYFANPMCSWCWGFAPALRAVGERFPDLPVTVALGSLGADRASRPMTERDREYVRHHWERVHELTGQPFDFSFFGREGFVYDTAPPSRALLVIRQRFPGVVLPALHRMQELFYAQGVDITDRDELRRIAASFGIEPETFDALFDSAEVHAALAREWEQTARLGVAGYPTLLALAGGRARVVTIGWRPPAWIVAELGRLGVGA
jgi:putative protein-disulfide isomerase